MKRTAFGGAVATICVCIMAFSTGCAMLPSSSVLDDGISGYALGKEVVTPGNEEQADTLAAIDLMIEKYSGGVYRPVAEDPTELDSTVPDPPPSGSTEPSQGGSSVPAPTPVPNTPLDKAMALLLPYVGSRNSISTDIVSNDAQFYAVLREAVAETHQSLDIYCAQGYKPTFERINEMLYTELFEDLVLAFMCMTSYSTSYGYTESGMAYYSFTFNYSNEISYSQLISMKEESVRAAVNAAAKLDLYSATDYERVYRINEYLCDTVVYPDTEPYADLTHTAYGALVSGSAVCEGYARAAAALCLITGGECLMEVGYCGSPDAGHAWNLAKVDGSWYQLDITWNDGGDKDDIFSYFLVTDEFMRNSRTWDTSRYPSTPGSGYAVQ